MPKATTREASRPTTSAGRILAPIIARSRTIRHPIAPIALDCVKLIFVRHGSAILHSQFGEKLVVVGDVVALAANTLCGSEPEGAITVTTLYLDRDYFIDQVFWRHASFLTDRWEARDFADALYPEPAQILHLGEDRAGMLMPWLDELVALSIGDASSDRFFRMQALLFAVLDVTVPYVRTAPVHRTHSYRKACRRPGPSPLRQFAPLRTEARQGLELLRARPDDRWTLQKLATAVHLSPSQLGRIFLAAYGKTPMTYLSTVRVEKLARLLRETDLPVEIAMRQVGWQSRGHAARMFRQSVGVTPTRYRQLNRDKSAT